jgi:uncharacterized protein
VKAIAACILRPNALFASRVAREFYHAIQGRPNRHAHLPVISDPLFYLLAIPAVILLGLGKGGFAGIGMVSTPLLALAIPPLQGAAILLPLLIVQDAISVWAYRRAWSAWNLKVLIPGSVLGMAAGTLFASAVSNAAIELTIGIIGLGFVFYTWIGRTRLGRELIPALRDLGDKPRRPPIPLGLLWGAMSGFMSLLIQVGAPPFQIHILPQRLDKLTLVGTSVLFFAFMNEMKIVPYFLLGQFSVRNFATSLALLPLAIAANFLGIWLVHKTPTERFYQIAYILMFLISLVLLWQGWRQVGH